MYRSLGKFSNVLAKVPGATDFLDSLDGVDTSFLDRMYLLHWDVRDNLDGTLIELALAFEGELVLSLPDFSLVSVALGANIPGYTFLHGAATIGQLSRLDLYHLQATLRLDQPWLLPVSLEPDEPAPETFEIRVLGSFRIDTELNARPRLESFSIPPFTIGQTGLVLSLKNCQLDLSTLETPPPLLGLGYDETFRGIYAENAHFYWLPQASFNGLPGLRLDFSGVAVGETGVSFNLTQTFLVEHDGRTFGPGTELAGHLLDGRWSLALERLQGEVRQNVPRTFFAAGYLQVPFLDTIFAAEFGLQSRADEVFETSLVLRKTEGPPAQATVGAATLSLDQFNLDGTLAEDQFSLAGSLSGSLDLPGFTIQVEQADVDLQHTETQDELRLALGGVTLGPLGEVESASLHVRTTENAVTGDTDVALTIESEFSWQDLHTRLNLDDLPDEFPLPPDDAEITAFISFDTAPSTKVVLRFAAAVTDLDALWRFVPHDYRPEVEEARFAFEATYTDAAAFQNAAADSAFQGEVSVELKLRLPDLPPIPGLELLTIETGDADGWIAANLTAGTRPDPETGDQEPYLDLEIANPVSVDVDLPGLPQPQPPIHTAITRIELDLTAASDVEGTFTLAGDFVLRPVAPPPDLPMAAHLEGLLAGIGLEDLAGTATFTLAFKGDRAALALDCRFTDGEIEVDLLDMLAGLARGFAPPQGEASGNELPLEVEVGFGLRGVRLQLGSLDETEALAGFSLEMVIFLSLAGLSTEVFFLLSDREFAFGLAEDFAIPLQVPEFPLSLTDLDHLRGASGRWTFGAWEAYLDELDNAIAAFGDVSADPAGQKAKARLQAQEFMLRNMLGFYWLMPAQANKQAYQTQAELLVGVMHATTSALHIDTDVKLVLNGRRLADGTINENGVKFTLPFADPRDIGVHGSARLEGFSEDDPLSILENISLGLGLSSDFIYFSVESVGSPIEIPPIGRYDGGTVNLSRLRIGYGYTRNAFTLNFAGEVKFPDQLVEDADTSDLIGAGIRLPVYNALSFRLDLIPIVLGPVDFLMPLFEFDLDLRAPQSQALVRTQVCEPYWDGLQIIVDGLYHDALKHLAFSPFFGPLPLPNFRFDGDVSIGDGKNGVTIIVDNLLVLVGVWISSVPSPIPFFAEPLAPYFENLCVNLRLAGFGINFNLQRPFPSLSPLAIFEVIGLISNPMMPIDPQGSLANTMRITLSDAYITLPEAVLRIFPEAAGVVDKTLNVTLNVGTLITAVQAVAGTAGEITAVIEDTGQDIQARLRRLANNPPELSLSTLLSAVPPELRKLRLSGAFAGFDASAVVLLIDANDIAALREEFERRSQATPGNLIPDMEVGTSADPDMLTQYRPNLPAGPGQGRTYSSANPAESLFTGIEFSAFEVSDLDEVPAPRKPMGGVVVGAHVKLPTGQRFRFLGFLFEDGSFGLISALDIPPVRLQVAGIAVDFPLQVRGRLVLAGRAKRDGYYGSIKASGWGRWNMIPGIVSLEVAAEKKPATLALYSNGEFRAAGDVFVRLFNGSVTVDGTVEISHAHCLVAGDLEYRVEEIIRLQLEVEGRFGPGRHFQLQGGGSLAILGHELVDVKGVVSDQRASIEARLNSSEWTVAGTGISCDLRMALRGSIDLRRKLQPEFRLEGEGKLTALGASISGRGGIKRTNQALSTYMEGSLVWQGRDWLGGRLELGEDGMQLRGRTSFTLNLSPSNLASIQLAHLYFKIEISGEFVLNANRGLAGFELTGDWVLGARLPDNEHQVLPLASQHFQLDGGTEMNIPLLAASGFELLPFGGIQIPMPVIEGTSSEPVEFGDVDDNLAIRWQDHTLKMLMNTFPVITDEELTTKSGELHFNYDIGFSEDSAINIDFPVDAGFTLALVWREKKLQLKIKRGNSVRYKRLDDVFAS